MALAGYDAETSMKMLPQVLNLAAAGGIELASASDMVTDAQSALGLSLDETTTMVDQMAKTSSITNTSVAQLGEAFLTIGGTAKSLRGGTAELSQMLGVFADNGKKGAEGGTVLRNAIMSLTNPTSKAEKAMKSLGLQVYDSKGQMRAMPDIIQDLSGKLDGMTDEQKSNIIGKIFNKADIGAINSLLGVSADRWDEVRKGIDDAQGSAEKMANTQLDNLEGDVTLFKSALEGVQIALSEHLMPALRTFVQWGTEKLGQVTEKIKNGGLDGAFKMLEVTLKLVVNAIIFAVDNFNTFAPVIAGVTTAIIAFNTAMKISATINAVVTAVNAFRKANEGATIAQTLLNAVMMANPIAIVVSLLAGLVAAIVVAWNTNEGFRKAVIKVWNAIKSVVGGVLKNLAKTFSTVWGGIKTTVTTTMNNIKTAITTKINDAKTTVTNTLGKIKTAFGTILGGAYDTVKRIIDKIKGVFNFSWHLPELKLPHISVTGGEAPFGIGGMGSLPKFSIKWYKKAMNDGVILDNPTIFGMSNGNLLGGGEAGSELIVGKNNLLSMIKDASNGDNVVYAISTLLNYLQEELPRIEKRPVVVDDKALSRRVDSRLSDISKLKKRGQ